MDCPICLEIVEQGRNCVVTECGHCFHTNCLMTNVMHNGFGCPYCRDAMAKETNPDEEEEDDDESDYDDEDDDENDYYEEDYLLRGFRFFYNNLENVEHDTRDVYIETSDQVSEASNPDRTIPSNKYIIEKLQDNVSYSQLVNMIVDEHYNDSDNDGVGCSENMYNILSKINDIILEYNSL